MKKLLAATVAVLLVSGAAHAEYVFHYEGRTIRIDPDRGKVSIPGVYDNTGHHKKKAKAEPGETQPGQEAAKGPAGHDGAQAKEGKDGAANAPAGAAPPSPTATASNAAAASRNIGSPLGVWASDEKDGKVRIEHCGAVLCGYALDASDQNGEVVLINMKSGEDQQWTGRIVDPASGSTYDSTIALDGPDHLRVQCSSSAEFCAERTWSRVN